ncbi:MAG: reactive intermediate/imine deaminase [Deltaproteobacteria bacterium]|nr:reactive intermediate/imine deaminase [Deltaproteobacteria bacterium]MBI4223393.1 reactive intermediate/imine deaminase [Deltaproteobacteria bacterium]
MLPKPLGHYSQIVRAGDLFFLSGQIAIDPITNEICLFGGDAAKQTNLILKNIETILAGENLKKENIVKMTLCLTDLSQFSKVNEVYADFFGTHKPARTTVEVAGLPKGAAIEIETVAQS